MEEIQFPRRGRKERRIGRAHAMVTRDKRLIVPGFIDGSVRQLVERPRRLKLASSSARESAGDTRMETRGRGPAYIFIDSEPLASAGAAVARFLLSNRARCARARGTARRLVFPRIRLESSTNGDFLRGLRRSLYRFRFARIGTAGPELCGDLFLGILRSLYRSLTASGRYKRNASLKLGT